MNLMTKFMNLILKYNKLNIESEEFYIRMNAIFTKIAFYIYYELRVFLYIFLKKYYFCKEKYFGSIAHGLLSLNKYSIWYPVS